MLRRIWLKLFSRKWELLVLGAIVTFCAVITKFIAVDHWMSLNFEVTGYSPYAGPLGVVWMTAYLAVLKIRRVHAPSLWIMGILGLGYSFILLWMVNLK